MMNLHDCQWDPSIYGTGFAIDDSIFPEIRPSFTNHGEITSIPELEGVNITGVLGDQQASVVGLGLFEPGEIKATYGTGTFILMNTGEKAVVNAPG
jgi:glycerol kinase